MDGEVEDVFGRLCGIILKKPHLFEAFSKGPFSKAKQGWRGEGGHSVFGYLFFERFWSVFFEDAWNFNDLNRFNPFELYFSYILHSLPAPLAPLSGQAAVRAHPELSGKVRGFE